MTNEKEIDEQAASEQVVDTGAAASTEQPEQQVPLSALQAERQKRQEKEDENRYLRELATQLKAQQDSSAKTSATAEDDEDYVNKRDLSNFKDKLTKEEFAVMKREIAEDTFKEVNPEAIKQINTHLKDIIEKKPWLADSIATAPNRYARAYEIVKDYASIVSAKQSSSTDAKRIVENSKKPGSPTTVAKPANLSGADYLKSLAGKKEFNEYRKSVRQG